MTKARCASHNKGVFVLWALRGVTGWALGSSKALHWATADVSNGSES